MYKIKMLCFDQNLKVKPYEDEPCYNPPIKDFDEIYNIICELAEEEVNSLNETTTDNPFHVNKDNEAVYVVLTIDGEDTPITTYYIEEIS